MPSPVSAILPDVLVPGLAVVFCGTAAGERSARLGAYYAGIGNRFWKTLHEVGLTDRQLAPQEFGVLPTYGLGLTDLAKHISGQDDTLQSGDFDVAGFTARVLEAAPRAIGFTSKKSASVYFGMPTGALGYGRQTNRLENTAIFILPSTSGGARGFWDIAPWHDLAAFARASTAAPSSPTP